MTHGVCDCECERAGGDTYFLTCLVWWRRGNGHFCSLEILFILLNLTYTWWIVIYELYKLRRILREVIFTFKPVVAGGGSPEEPFIRSSKLPRQKVNSKSREWWSDKRSSSNLSYQFERHDLPVRGSLAFDWVELHTILGLNQVLAPKVKSSFKKTFLDPEKAFLSWF